MSLICLHNLKALSLLSLWYFQALMEFLADDVDDTLLNLQFVFFLAKKKSVVYNLVVSGFDII